MSLGKEIVLKVFFKDEALPNAKVNIHGPNTWSKNSIPMHRHGSF